MGGGRGSIPFFLRVKESFIHYSAKSLTARHTQGNDHASMPQLGIESSLRKLRKLMGIESSHLLAIHGGKSRLMSQSTELCPELPQESHRALNRQSPFIMHYLIADEPRTP